MFELGTEGVDDTNIHLNDSERNIIADEILALLAKRMKEMEPENNGMLCSGCAIQVLDIVEEKIIAFGNYTDSEQAQILSERANLYQQRALMKAHPAGRLLSMLFGAHSPIVRAL